MIVYTISKPMSFKSKLGQVLRLISMQKKIRQLKNFYQIYLITDYQNNSDGTKLIHEAGFIDKFMEELVF